MLALINTNRMAPLIGPIGLDYVAASAQKASIEVEILDLGLVDEPADALREYFCRRDPELVGITLRNADDCFWPSADCFVPGLKDVVETIRTMSEAPIVLGGVGYSIFPRAILEFTNADFGVWGDGDAAIAPLVHQLRTTRRFTDVPGLLWREENQVRSNPPSWPDPISLGTARDFIDNRSYFKRGGQCGLETKRGCNRKCIYCADPLAKGSKLRLRNPSEVADEVQSLLAQGIDVLHLCDAEFNIPRNHAYAVCEELNARSLGERIRWYTYMSPSPFDEALAEAMARAGCAGINFTGDSACETMLRAYGQRHRREDLAAAVKLCRQNAIAVMIDLLLGGPGETRQTVRETIDFMKQIDPDCAGAALGIRIYPGTTMEKLLARELREQGDGSIRRKYSGPIDLLKPTFYISRALGERPAEFVRDLIASDERFFEPAVEIAPDAEGTDASNYNYNENLPLTRAIEKGARGAYWDILRQLRKS
jgi:radical SAM superfamily enzyme YgiQ (UPF0313 family)